MFSRCLITSFRCSSRCTRSSTLDVRVSPLPCSTARADLSPFFAVFVIVNIWTIFIHDSDMISGHWLENIINGPAHHTLHHLHFTVNYGQYFTWSDRTGGSYRKPDPSLDPIHEVERIEREKEKRAKADAVAGLEIVEVPQGEDPTDPLNGSAVPALS